MRRLSTMALTAAVLAVATPATAHTDLVSTTPATGAVITAPTPIELVFSEPPIADGVAVAVEDAEGAVHIAQVSGVEGAAVHAEWPGDVASGMAMINWRVTADDGHVLQGSIHVTYQPADDTTSDDATAEPAADPTTTHAEVVATPVATASPMTLGPGSADADLTWWITGCVLLATGGLLIFLLGKRRG